MNQDQRLRSYLEKYQDLKERSAVKEVLEREMLQVFIHGNMDRIDEFPLLETEQSSIIDIVCHRSVGLPAYDFIREWLADFLLSINKYAKASSARNQAEIDEHQAAIINVESLLVQCIQGIVYVMSLTKDNLAHAMVRLFGASTLEVMNDITATVEFNEAWWRSHVERIVCAQLELAYTQLLARKQYALTRDKTTLTISFCQDDLLVAVGYHDTEIKPTRIQAAFASRSADEAARRVQGFVSDFLESAECSLLNVYLEPKALGQVARIISISQLADNFYQAYGHGENTGASLTSTPPGESSGKSETLSSTSSSQSAPQSEALATDAGLVAPADGNASDSVAASLPAAEPEKAGAAAQQEPGAEEQDETVQKVFLKAQVLAMAAGVVLARSIIFGDCSRAFRELKPQERAAVLAQIEATDQNNMNAAMQMLLGGCFCFQLQEKGREEGGKLFVRTIRLRRVPQEAIQKLYPYGMNRIREKKFWEDDPSAPDQKLFRSRTAQEFKELIEFFHIGDTLRRMLITLWAKASFRSDHQVVINLAQLAKVTTKLSQRLGEVLARYDIGPRPGVSRFP